jgi:hypothetical protein
MSVNIPPNPNVATFNNLYWINFDIGSDGLTEAEADLLYLKFPVAQGTEDLQAITINGLTTANDDINIADGTLGTSSLNQTTTLLTITAPVGGSVKILPSITFADNTIQTTAYTGGGLSPDPAGTYTTPSSVVVNSSGQVTSAVSGTTYNLPSPAPAAGAYTAPSSVSVNAEGQVTAITAGTAYTIPSPAAGAGAYTTPSSVSINAEGQVTAITAGTTYTIPSPAAGAGAYTAPSSISINAEGQVTAITAGTAYTLPSPVPTAGSYTNSNITINSAGQVTAASNGSAAAGGYPIATATQQPPLNNAYVWNTFGITTTTSLWNQNEYFTIRVTYNASWANNPSSPNNSTEFMTNSFLINIFPYRFVANWSQVVDNAGSVPLYPLSWVEQNFISTGSGGNDYSLVNTGTTITPTGTNFGQNIAPLGRQWWAYNINVENFGSQTGIGDMYLQGDINYLYFIPISPYGLNNAQYWGFNLSVELINVGSHRAPITSVGFTTNFSV